jgi:hypothetical protein
MKKHTKLKVIKREKPGIQPRGKKFIPKYPISKNKFIKQIKEVKDDQYLKIKEYSEAVFVIEKYENSLLSEIEKIVEERWNGKILLFLTETEFLVKVPSNELDNVIEKFYNSEKDLYQYIKRTIKNISPLLWDKKITKDVKIKLEKISAPLKIIGLIIPGLTEKEYLKIIKKLKKEYTSSEIQEAPFRTSSLLTFQALVDKKSVKDIANQPYIYLISEPQKIIFNQMNAQNHKKKFSPREIEISERLQKPEICIIDSGIDSPSLKNCISLIDGHPTLHGNFYDSINGHGTEVSSIAAFGDELIFNNNLNKNLCDIISYKLADTIIEDPLFSCLYDAIQKYKSKTRIYNISATYQHYNLFSDILTNQIDNLIQKENVILVNSAGNITFEQIEDQLIRGVQYPEYLNKFPCRNPSNGKNVLSIGSYAIKDNKKSICRKYQISPFSAKGKFPDIKDNRIKPDLFAVGGNIEKKTESSISYKESLGIPVISISRKKITRNGTSYSAPYISHILAHLDKIYATDNVETLKAILLSCCNFSNNNLLIDRKNKICYSNSNSNIILYAEGVLGLKKWKKDIKRFMIENDNIRFYVPKGIKEIRIVIIHSDNSTAFSCWYPSTMISAEIQKPSRKKRLESRDARIWHLNKKSTVQFAVFNYKKGETGDWYIILKPDYNYIRPSDREKIKIRYGIAINLIVEKQQNIIEDPYDIIQEKLVM